MDEETIDWILSDTTLDPFSKVPYATVVFMLYYGLEIKHNLLKSSEALMKDFKAEIHDFGKTAVYLAGSAAQGFYLNTNDFLDARDIDIVAIYKRDVRKKCEYDDEHKKQELTLNIDEEDNNGICTDRAKAPVNVTDESFPPYLNVETWDDTYPGYVMLRKCRKHELPVQTSLANRYVSSLKTTQSRTEFWRNVQSYLEEDFRSVLDHNRDLNNQILSTVHTQGPSASATFSNMFLHISLDSDLVYALPYPGWPEIANKWFDRQPASGWPDSSLKQDIKTTGCLIVPKGHKGSRREDYEWRISFSLGELKLARSLNRIQREVAHIFKALLSEEQYEFGRASIVAKLDSYFILNLLFQESESIKEEEWRERNAAQIMFQMLDKLSSCIKGKNLPHYFVPENNLLFKLLLDQVKLGDGEFERGRDDESVMMDTQEYIDFALYTVLRLRYDPLGQLLQQGRYLQLPAAMHTDVFEPLVQRVKATQTIDPGIYVSTLVKLAKAHLYKNRFGVSNIYVTDAARFLEKLPAAQKSETIVIELKITQAICSYLVGNFDTALQLFEEIFKDNDCSIPGMFEENKDTCLVLFARTLASKAVMAPENYGMTLKSKAKRLLEKAVAINSYSNPAIMLELVNYFMKFGYLLEADELLMKIQEYLIMEEEDNAEMADLETMDPEVVYYREAYTVPVVEEPIYSVVYESDTEDSQMVVDTEIEFSDEQMSENCQEKYCDGQPVSFGISENSQIGEPQKSVMTCKSAHLSFEATESDNEECGYKESLTEDMAFQIEELKLSPVEQPGDHIQMIQVDDQDNSNGQGEYEIEELFRNKREQNLLSNEFSSLDEQLMYNNVLDNFEDDLERDISFEEQTFINRFDDEKERLIFSEDKSKDYSRPILNFLENQDLINEYALFRAFTKLDLLGDAERVYQRISAKIHERQKSDKTITMEALEHDFLLYISYEEAPLVTSAWENPFAIFKEDVVFCTGDEHILDEILNALVQKRGVVSLHVNDLYFHFRTQLAKYDNRISEALELIKYMQNPNLKRVHYDFLGEKEKAETEAFHASLKRGEMPVHDKISQWIRKLKDAVIKFEPRNEYLESVFS